jgi:hypothetical protein
MIEAIWNRVEEELPENTVVSANTLWWAVFRVLRDFGLMNPDANSRMLMEDGGEFSPI